MAQNITFRYSCHLTFYTYLRIISRKYGFKIDSASIIKRGQNYTYPICSWNDKHQALRITVYTAKLHIKDLKPLPSNVSLSISEIRGN